MPGDVVTLPRRARWTLTEAGCMIKPVAWDGGSGPRRVFVEDARGNGQFLRVTWHAERQQFVFSNWDDDVCVGATRVPVAEGAELIGLLASGLAQAVPPHGVVESPEALTLADHLKTWWRGRGRRAPVIPFRGGAAERGRRSA